MLDDLVLFSELREKYSDDQSQNTSGWAIHRNRSRNDVPVCTLEIVGIEWFMHGQNSNTYYRQGTTDKVAHPLTTLNPAHPCNPPSPFAQLLSCQLSSPVVPYFLLAASLLSLLSDVFSRSATTFLVLLWRLLRARSLRLVISLNAASRFFTCSFSNRSFFLLGRNLLYTINRIL